MGLLSNCLANMIDMPTSGLHRVPSFTQVQTHCDAESRTGRIDSLRRLLPVLVFVVSLLIAGLYWALAPESLHADNSTDFEFYYEPVARNLVEGRGFSNIRGESATANPPGYPLFLATAFKLSSVTGISENVVLKALNLLMVGLGSVFLFLTSRSVWGDGRALLTSLVWMTYPFNLWLIRGAHTEILFEAILFAGFGLLWHALMRRKQGWWLYLVIGIVFGLAMLVRSIALGLGGIAALVIWIRFRGWSLRARVLAVGSVLLGNLIVVLPWQVWLYGQTGTAVLLGTNGLPSVRDGLTFAVISKDYRESIQVPQDVENLMDVLRTRTQHGELRSLSEIASVMLEEAQARPVVVAKLLVIKAARSWYGTDSGRRELATAAILAVILGGSVLSWRRYSDTRPLILSIWLVTLYFLGMAVSVLSILRYMVPTMGLLFILLPGLLPDASSSGVSPKRLPES